MLKVLKPGFYTTLQDRGRFNYRNKGVPVSGCMDLLALEQLNLLLENEKDSAVLELTMTGPSLLFEAPTYMAITGADMTPMLNETPIVNHKVYQVNAGDTLSFGKLNSGFRSYLAVKGGFLAEPILGSMSQYVPLTEKPCIAKGDAIGYASLGEFTPKISEMKPDNYVHQETIHVHKGPEFHLLSETQIDELLERTFTIAKENNRMAYQIEGHMEGHSFSMLTSATLPGTVQFTPTGKLIILMRDGQTTGGYPRILQLTKEAICSLAQKKTGDPIRFELSYS